MHFVHQSPEVVHEKIAMCPSGDVVWDQYRTQQTLLFVNPSSQGTPAMNASLPLLTALQWDRSRRTLASAGSSTRNVAVRTKIHRIPQGSVLLRESPVRDPASVDWLFPNAVLSNALQAAGGEIKGVVVDAPRVHMALVERGKGKQHHLTVMDFAEGDHIGGTSWDMIYPTERMRSRFYKQALARMGFVATENDELIPGAHCYLDEHEGNSKVMFDCKKVSRITRFDLGVSPVNVASMHEDVRRLGVSSFVNGEPSAKPDMPMIELMGSLLRRG